MNWSDMVEKKYTDVDIIMDMPAALGLFRSFVNGFPGILIYFDTNLKVVWGNKAAFENFGDIVGGDCCAALGMAKKDCLDCFMRKSLGDKGVKKAVREGVLILSETGDTIEQGAIFEIIASPVVEADQVVGALALINNITERFELEKRLRQTQKMEAIGTLAGGVAHDFNNVLTPIIGYSEIIRLKMRQDGVSDPLIEEYLGEILVASRRAKQLVEQILTFSRSAEQKKTLQYVQPIIKEVARLVRTMLPSTIKIRQDLDAQCGRISIDPVHLHQVLVNLCSNSGQAMENTHGELVLALQCGEMDDFGQEWLQITVSDTGCGIPPNMLERIFDPYFTTREKEQGTGMGLAVVHGIVHNQGGRLKVESEVGVGTSFHLFFPLCMEETTLEQIVDLSELQHGQGNVLLVDDEAQVVDVSAELLKSLGYKVSGVTSSRKALSMFLSSPDSYDLLITDLTMPELTGIELCAEVKKIRPDLPVILCTGYSEKVTAELLEKLGVSRYCTKPVSMRDFADAVGAVL